jgi:hypothetical protein
MAGFRHARSMISPDTFHVIVFKEYIHAKNTKASPRTGLMAVSAPWSPNGLVAPTSHPSVQGKDRPSTAGANS